MCNLPLTPTFEASAPPAVEQTVAQSQEAISHCAPAVLHSSINMTNAPPPTSSTHHLHVETILDASGSHMSESPDDENTRARKIHSILQIEAILVSADGG